MPGTPCHRREHGQGLDTCSAGSVGVLEITILLLNTAVGKGMDRGRGGGRGTDTGGYTYGKGQQYWEEWCLGENCQAQWGCALLP